MADILSNRSTIIGGVTYFNPTPGDFPIMGVGKRYGYSYYDYDTLELFQECGINIVENTMWGAPPTPEVDLQTTCRYSDNADKNIALSVNSCAANGIYLMVRRPLAAISNPIEWVKWRNAWLNTVKVFKSFPNVGAWMLADEPESKIFSELGAMAALIQREDAKRSVYNNLFPSYGFSESGYDIYIQRAKDYLKPQIWSTDFYLFRINSANEIVYRSGFFEYLIQYRTLALNDGVVFWPTIQTCKESSDSHLPSSLLSEGRVQFQMACALAFGCQGLVIFRMTGDSFLNTGANSYAPIVYTKKSDEAEDWDNNQVVTPLYDMVKTLVWKVRRTQKIFLNGEVTNIQCTNPDAKDIFNVLSTLPDNGSVVESAFELEANGAISNNKARLLVSSISNLGEKFIMVVNLDWEKYQSFRLVFKPLVREVDTTKVFEYSNMPLKGENFHTFKGTLNPSEWRLYKVV